MIYRLNMTMYPLLCQSTKRVVLKMCAKSMRYWPNSVRHIHHPLINLLSPVGEQTWCEVSPRKNKSCMITTSLISRSFRVDIGWSYWYIYIQYISIDHIIDHIEIDFSDVSYWTPWRISSRTCRRKCLQPSGRHQGSAGERRPRILWKLGAEIEIAASVWQQQMVGHTTTTTTTCFQNQNSKPHGSVSKPCTPGEHQNSW